MMARLGRGPERMPLACPSVGSRSGELPVQLIGCWARADGAAPEEVRACGRPEVTDIGLCERHVRMIRHRC